MATLDLSVEFLSGTYHADAWPPSPAKLYQALLAGARYRFRRGGSWRPQFAEAFRWLERQAAPTIVAPVSVEGSPYRFFGPDNDMDLVVREWLSTAAGRPPREPLDPATLRSEIERRPWYVRGRVHYLYRGDDAPLGPLEEVAESLVALGHGIDLAAGRAAIVSDEDAASIEGVRWTPTAGSTTGTVGLFAPTEGWYDRLEENYAAWRRPPDGGTIDVRKGSVPPSVRPLRYATDLRMRQRPYLAFAMRAGGGSDEVYSVGWERTIEIAARLRHATSVALRAAGGDEPTIRVYALGHGAGGERERRLSYLPLPSVGHEHSDGRVRRALVASFGGDVRLETLRPILEGQPLVAPGAPTSRLDPLPRDDGVLSRYVGPARRWASVTPVILHGHDARRGRVDSAKTHRLLTEAIQQAELPGAVAKFEYRLAPWWAGTGPARAIRVPEHLAQWPRYHLRIELRDEVTGPLIIGIGRHYGLGLLAAVNGRVSS